MSNLTPIELINADLTKLSKNELLSRAKKYYFRTGISTSGASKLAQINTAYGLSKVHFAQFTLGFNPNACFISTPDQTITRNEYRWDWGCGYGGKWVWGDGGEKIVFPDPKPNACGMLVGALNELPNFKETITKATSLRSHNTEIDGIRIKWDFEKSNHFIDVFEKLENPYEPTLSDFKYFFVMHSSAPEMKNIYPGIYIDSPVNGVRELYNLCEHVNTPFGECNVLLDDNAKLYYDFCQRANELSKARREVAAEKIFGDYTVISNVNHQCLTPHNMNELLLGAQSTLENCLLPIALNSRSEMYLMRGKKTFSDEEIEENGWYQRAKSRGLLDVLRNANIMPHGGGYELTDVIDNSEVIESGNKRYYVCNQENTTAPLIFSNPKELEFEYRKTPVVIKAVNKGMCEKAAVLTPKFVIKF